MTTATVAGFTIAEFVTDGRSTWLMQRQYQGYELEEARELFSQSVEDQGLKIV